jgi:mannitol/fructose-specific phosphotransferase system IIA component (Ntr-type)
MLELKNLILEKNIIFNFNPKNKIKAIRRILEHGILNGTITRGTSPEIYKLLLERERTISTGIGSGVAIPHCSSNIIEETHAYLAISPDGLDFESTDNQNVHIIIMLLAPKGKFGDHIKILANIAKTLGDKEVRQKIIEAKNYQDYLNAFGNS